MRELLPLDFGELFHQELLSNRRENDGLLHPSGDLIGSLRHTQLSVAGAPTKTNPLINEITLMTGTLWHDWFARTLQRLGLPFMSEVNLTPWLPPGWAGTADALVWNPEVKGFLLVDFKTIKGTGIRFVAKDGAKPEHRAQASAYWYAARNMGLPMLKEIAVLYWPKDDVPGQQIEPLLVSFEPLPKAPLHKKMAKRSGAVTDYLESLGGRLGDPGSVKARPLPDWVTPALAPEQERVQKAKYNKGTGTTEVILVPHWSAAYCPYPDELCACSTQGTTKIGEYVEGTYYPRSGYEKIKPTV